MSKSTQSSDQRFEQSLINAALDALENGEIILYPTDTVWGLGCDPFDKQAVEHLREIKQRSADKPFILLVSSHKQLKQYINKIHPRVETLLHHHERPLTMVYHSVRRLPDYLKAKDGSVAIRVVQDTFCKALIDAFGQPITSTSANLEGEPVPSHFGEISSDIIEAVDHVVKYRQEEKMDEQPSTIATYGEDGKLEFIRE